MVPIIIIIFIYCAWILSNIRRQLSLTYWWQVKEFRLDRFLLFSKTAEGRSRLEVKIIFIKLAILVLSFLFSQIALLYIAVVLYELYKLLYELKTKTFRKPVPAIRSNNVISTSVY